MKQYIAIVLALLFSFIVGLATFSHMELMGYNNIIFLEGKCITFFLQERKFSDLPAYLMIGNSSKDYLLAESDLVCF